MRGWWPPCSDDPVSSSVVTGALVAGHDHVNMEGGVIQPVSIKVNLKQAGGRYPLTKEMSIPTLALYRTVVLSVARLECPPLCRDSHPPQLSEPPVSPTSVSTARQCDVLNQTMHKGLAPLRNCLFPSRVGELCAD